MSRVSIPLSRRQGIVALLLVAGFTGFRWRGASATFPDEGQEVLLQHVRFDVLRELQERPDLGEEARREAILAQPYVAFQDVQTRGKPDDLLVRVILAPSPAVLPGMEGPRYFKIKYSTILGWELPDATTARAWRLRFP